MYNFGKTEKLILVITSVLFLMSSYFLYDDSLLFTNTEKVIFGTIGHFSDSKNDVRRKNAGTFSWLPASTKESVFQSDSIFTGENSNVTINLDDGSQILLEANSLITLNNKNGQMQLDLRFGNLVSEIAQSSSIVITSGSDVLKVEGQPKSKDKTQIRLNKSKSETVRLKLISGEANVLSNSKNITSELTKGATLTIDNKGEIKKTESQILSVEALPDESSLVRMGPFDPLHFAWKSKGAVANFELEISSTEDFKSLLISKKTSNNKIIITSNLPTGSLFWRVKALDLLGQIGATSSNQKIIIKDLPAPEITFPVNLTTLKIELPEPEGSDPISLVGTVDLKWQAPPDFKTFKFQLAKDSAFNQIQDEGLTSELLTQVKNVSNGTYWLRVAGQTDKKISSTWSKPVSFSLDITQAIATPLLPPTIKNNRITYHQENPKLRHPSSVQGPLIQWTPNSPNLGFQLQISKSKRFENPEVYELNSPENQWTNFKAGTSYYRVIALGKKSKTSLPSNIGVIKVIMSPPNFENINPIQNQGEVEVPTEANLKWSEVSQASAYNLEIDSSSEFKNPKSYLFNSNNGQIKIEKPGNYKIRVQALDGEKHPISDFSALGNLEYTFQLLLKQPEPLEPFNKASIFLQSLNETSIWIEWSKVKSADSYQIELSNTEDFSTILYSKSVGENHFLVTQKLPVGKIFWRIRAENMTSKKISNWSNPQHFILFHKKIDTL